MASQLSNNLSHKLNNTVGTTVSNSGVASSQEQEFSKSTSEPYFWALILCLMIFVLGFLMVLQRARRTDLTENH